MVNLSCLLNKGWFEIIKTFFDYLNRIVSRASYCSRYLSPLVKTRTRKSRPRSASEPASDATITGTVPIQVDARIASDISSFGFLKVFD